MKAAHRQGGFTLIEIAIVLVIIGLLLGGILKGQELITSARVRNLISQQDGIKAAFYGFQDRYRALPGDYQQAAQNLGGTGTISFGNGDGRVQNGVTPVSGSVANEANLVWEHMTRAGFLNGNFVYGDGSLSDGSTPKNPYGAFVQLIYDNMYGAGSGPDRHNLKTGSQVPVEIMAEVDRKTDDGNPVTGSFVFSTFAGAGAAPKGDTFCYVAASSSWKVSGPTEVNCGGATLL